MILSKLALITVAKDLIGTPYIWAGNSNAGLDCSGFILKCFELIGYKFADTNASGIYDKWKIYKKDYKNVAIGDLIFYGDKKNNQISHVMMCLNKWDNGSVVVVGARGGDSTTTTIAQASIKKAFVSAELDYWSSGVMAVLDIEGILKNAEA